MDLLVAPSWVADHLTDTKVILLDASLPLVGVHPVVDVRARYREQHILGAIFFDIEALSDRTTSLPTCCRLLRCSAKT